MNSPSEKISALIITYNEIGYIEKCIESMVFADEIIVVDSYSTDGTFEYLENHPKVKVIQRPFENFTDQKSFALRQASNDWVLFLDADEVLTPKLQNEIQHTINSGTKKNAFWFYRTFMFKDEKVFFSGCQTDKNYRLFRKSKVAFAKDKIVHETLNVIGESGTLKTKLIHYSYKDYSDFKGKILKYGRMKAIESLRKGRRFSYAKLVIKPIWKFFNRYIIRLGLFDGFKGLVLSYIHARGVVEHYKTLKALETETRTSTAPISTILERAA
ncbi:glycosyltransferase family 2 protein [Zobellia barbeyronii]|uniref:Glycosyltransferase family 2 protein n=1 Tax=Zobellia barbeyronii TaxID=2748009 RepID=A0ABS5WJ80_9FLAO|nr:glycosyltransferase family 2 protein [Zobellia barbeyronii]MBT2163458.1 glycosyltransferase family 2 protein [Zobellia barbeyronii]